MEAIPIPLCTIGKPRLHVGAEAEEGRVEGFRRTVDLPMPQRREATRTANWSQQAELLCADWALETA